MPDSIEVKLRTQAQEFTALTRLIGSGPTIRWYKLQLRQGSEYPAVVVMNMPGPRMYVSTGQLPTNYGRVQFTLWDTDPERIDELAGALNSFLQGFSCLGLPDAIARPNYVMGDRAMVFPKPEPVLYQRIIDVMIYQNEEV